MLLSSCGPILQYLHGQYLGAIIPIVLGLSDGNETRSLKMYGSIYSFLNCLNVCFQPPTFDFRKFHQMLGHSDSLATSMRV